MKRQRLAASRLALAGRADQAPTANGAPPAGPNSTPGSPARGPTIAAPTPGSLPATRTHGAFATPAQPPSIEFGPLYQAVEMQATFGDSKSFADAVPREPPRRIMAAYRRGSTQPGFDLKAFVLARFTLPAPGAGLSHAVPHETVQAYITRVWDVLRREPDQVQRFSSLLPLPKPYVVPGGRFREIYYWDSYFSMLGLQQANRRELARDMLQNMASLIDRYGHVPNGNRTYYLSRSEPPFFACMLDLLARTDGTGVYLTYLPELQREYDYWMEGADGLGPGRAHRHVVRLRDHTLLNRYWDDRDTPRDESFREDVLTARKASRPPQDLYRDLRAGAETGWDFSSRWLADGVHLSTIRTTSLLPVDLNSLLAHMEQTLSLAYGLRSNGDRRDAFQRKADQRIAAMRRLMWVPQRGAFFDYVWTEQKPSASLSAATVLPLFLHLATDREARAVAQTLQARLLAPGGLATTRNDSGQQWDSPNGWAPMQWMAVSGLRNYNNDALARIIAQRWIGRELSAYRNSGFLMEKYNIQSPGQRAGGGEYPLQVGFGWTNGVLAALLALYPDLPASGNVPAATVSAR